MIHQTRIVTAALSAALLIGATGCSHHTSPTVTVTPHTSTAAPTPTPSASTSTVPAPTTREPSSSTASSTPWGDRGPQAPEPTQLATASDKQALVAAEALAVRSLRLYLRRDVTAAQWISDLKPWLTPNAVEMYTGTRPYKIPRAALAGAKPRLASTSNTVLAKMQVPTTGGVFTVVMSRPDSTTQTWRVERFDLPDGLGG